MRVRIHSFFLFLLALSVSLLCAPARAQGYTDSFDFPTGVFDSQQNRFTFDAAGNLYGTSPDDGADSRGFVWELTVGGVFKDLHDFGGTVPYSGGTTGLDGEYPDSNVAVDVHGNLYGATCEGGTHNNPSPGDGVAWEIPNGGSYEVIHSFNGQVTYTDGTTGPDGNSPEGQVAVDGSGNLFGSTAYGGENDGAMLWEITSGGTYKDLYDLAFNSTLIAGITLDSSDDVYGTSWTGGVYNYGYLWEFTAGGVFKDLHDFGSGTDGQSPFNAPVVLDSAGDVFGTTEAGGTINGQGILWELTSGGNYSDLHDFGGTVTNLSGSSDTDGEAVSGNGVALDSSGNLYGASYYGGNNGLGMIFELTALGRYVDLYDFSNSGTDGYYPTTGITFDASGNFYGGTFSGGANGTGIIWEISAIDHLTVSPNSVLGNAGSTGTVSISFTAPAGGRKVNLSSSKPNFVSVPSSVTIPEGQSSTTFPITTQDYASAYDSIITANDGAVLQQASLVVQPLAITALSASPNPVSFGTACTGTVTISPAAPAGGLTVNLSSNTPYVGVPTSVVIPQGSTSTTFPITTKNYDANYTASIKASYSVSSKSTSLSVESTYLTGISANPNPVAFGAACTGTVTINQAAPAGGWTVNLSSNTSYVGVPASVVVPQGSTGTTFPITTKNYNTNYTATIKASDSVTSSSTSLGVTSTFLTGISATPNPVFAGGTCTGTVTISQAAPAGGWTVNLSSNTPYVGVPSSVVVAAGSTTATFPITPGNYTANYVATLTGKDSVTSKSTGLTVDSITIASLSLSPASVPNGTSSQGTVTLSDPAPAGGCTIQLSSSEPGYASVPASINIPAGSTQGVFTVTTGIGTVKVVMSVTITASHLPSSQSATLQVTP